MLAHYPSGNNTVIGSVNELVMHKGKGILVLHLITLLTIHDTLERDSACIYNMHIHDVIDVVKEFITFTSTFACLHTV